MKNLLPIFCKVLKAKFWSRTSGFAVSLYNKFSLRTLNHCLNGDLGRFKGLRKLLLS